MIKKLFIVAGISTLVSVIALTGAAALASREIGTKGYAISLVKENEGMRIRKGDNARAIVKTKTVPWAGGNTLTLDLAAKVQYVQGAENSIVITGPQALLDAVKIDNGHLWIMDTEDEPETINFMIGPDGFEAKSDHEGLKIVVTAPSIDTFLLNGDGDLEVYNYDQPKLSVDLSGNGVLEVSGQTKMLKIVQSGNGQSDLGNLRAQDADVLLSGSGNTKVRAVGKANVNISGAGHVEMATKPETLVSHISGSGSLDQY